MVVWGQYSKTVISLLLGMGFKRIIHQIKDNMCLHAKIGNRIKMNMN